MCVKKEEKSTKERKSTRSEKRGQGAIARTFIQPVLPKSFFQLSSFYVYVRSLPAKACARWKSLRVSFLLHVHTWFYVVMWLDIFQIPSTNLQYFPRYHDLCRCVFATLFSVSYLFDIINIYFSHREIMIYVMGHESAKNSVVFPNYYFIFWLRGRFGRLASHR